MGANGLWKTDYTIKSKQNKNKAYNKSSDGEYYDSWDSSLKVSLWMCHYTIRIYKPKSTYHRMKSLHRETRLRYGNPTGELVQILCRRINAYKRYKRISKYKWHI